MYQPSDIPITSINALAGTIQTNKEVRRWFEHLIQQKDIKSELSGGKEIGSYYLKYGNFANLEKAIYVLLFCALMLTVLTRQPPYVVFMAALFTAGVLVQLKKKECVVRISLFLLGRDFTRLSLAQKTLYQIGEIYARQYNTFPLVHAVTSTDAIKRKAVLYTILFVTFIYPLDFWQICAAVLAAYYVFYNLASLTCVYGRIK